MSDKKDVVFLKGTAKKKTFDNGGSLLNHSIKVEQLVKILEWINKKRAELGLEPTLFINLTTKERKETDEYGNTHYTVYEPWFPSPKGGAPEKKEDSKGDDKEKFPWD